MKRILETIVCSTVCIAMLPMGSQANEVSSGVSVNSIRGAGRNIMRTADGGIVSAYAVAWHGRSTLVFGHSLDNGKNWINAPLRQVAGSVVQVALDSNFQGSYIAFTEEVGGRRVARIAFSSAPFAAAPKFVLSGAVTPAGVIPQDTFIQASRAGWGDRAAENRRSVVYGWQDAASRALYIGVSPDGRNFPMAKLVVRDPQATSGPSVAIRGDYVVATYQTTNPDFAPTDVAPAVRGKRAYPAWIESLDGGKTWSVPQPLFGRTSSAFPTARVTGNDGGVALYRLAGGTELPNSPILNWATSRALEAAILQPDKTLPIDPRQLDGFPIDELPKDRFPIDALPRQKSGGKPGSPVDGPSGGTPVPNATGGAAKPVSMIDPLGGTTFVQTSMRSLDGDGSQGEVSIVSFRPIEPGAKWTHVIANNPLTTSPAKIDRVTSLTKAHGAQFQYSALIDTAVRATTYQEFDPSAGRVRLVAAVSTDTGKNFNRHISFDADDLAKFGIVGFDARSTLTVSQCLFEDRGGEVYVDILFTNDGRLTFASLPIGVNAAQLRAAERARLAAR